MDARPPFVVYLSMAVAKAQRSKLLTQRIRKIESQWYFSIPNAPAYPSTFAQTSFLLVKDACVAPFRGNRSCKDIADFCCCFEKAVIPSKARANRPRLSSRNRSLRLDNLFPNRGNKYLGILPKSSMSWMRPRGSEFERVRRSRRKTALDRKTHKTLSQLETSSSNSTRCGTI